MHQVQMLLHDERYLAALRAAGPLATDPERPAEERVEAALVAAIAAIELELYQDGRHYALLAKEQTQYREHSAKANHYFGAALLGLHEPEEAETALLAALAHEDTEHITKMRHTILYNLALSYERRHQDQMAWRVYRQAGAAFLLVGRSDDAIHAWLDAAWLALLVGNTAEARLLLSDAAEHVRPDTHQDEDNLRVLDLYASYLEGDSQRAVELAEELLHPRRRAVHPWCRTLAAITAAEVALKEDRIHLARGILRTASGWVSDAGCVKLCNLLADVRRRAGA